MQADDWPQWRGPNRDNVSVETGLLKEWPEKGPPLVFQIEGLGQGIAPAAIVGDRGFTISEFDGYEYVVAFDARTGQRLWLTPIGIQSKDSIAYNRLMRWLSQRMPNVYEGRVYAVTEYGLLVCLSADDGSLLWSKDYRQEYGVGRQTFGYCDYPLVVGDHLICVPGGEQATAVALDRRSGTERWRCILAPDTSHRQENRFQRSAYAATLHGRHQEQGYYIVTTNSAIHFLAEHDGTLIAKYDGVNQSIANSHTAIFDDGDLVLTNGYAGGMSRLKIESTTSGIAVTELFHKPLRFDAFQDIGLIVHGKLFQIRSGSILIQIDPLTGTETQDRLMGGRFAHTFADGQLYLVDVNGQVSLIDHDAEDLALRSEFQLPDIKPASGVTMPVIANKKLYLRFDDRLFCFDISAELSELSHDANVVRHQRPALDPALAAPGLPRLPTS